MNLLEKVKELCLEKGISQRKLESELSLSNGATSKWGKSSPSADVLQKVANFFNVSMDYLLGKNPFKTETEAYHSISVEAMKYLMNHKEELPEYYELHSGLYRMFDEKIDSESAIYAQTLLHKFENDLPLSNLELFELSNIIFSEIKWSKDFDGVIYLKNFEDDSFNIRLDIDKINRINLDLSESTLLKAKNLDDDSYLKYSSVLNNELNKRITNEDSKTGDSGIHTIAAHLDGAELTEEEQEQLNDYIQFLLSRRNK